MTRSKNALYKAAKICECYFAYKIPIKVIAIELNVDLNSVSNAISRYLRKPETDLVLQSKINDPTPKRDYYTVLILDRENGLFYKNAAEASRSSGIPHRTLCSYLRKDRKQKANRWMIA